MAAAERVHASVCAWLDTNLHDLCVAYSGGVDSSVLLSALATALRQRGELSRLSAVHVHHGLQANADSWREHCARVANALGIPFHAYQASIDRNDSRGIEAAARDARYALFKQHLARYPNQRLLIAQHARDQAETVLLQLLRGAGPPGLSGMADETLRWSRPLLNVAKADIDAYQVVHAVSHINDESNADTHYTRNRLRAKVWPVLIANFPAAEATLARSARWQQEASELADALGEIDFNACESGWGISISRWAQLSSARRRNLLRHWLARLTLPAQNAARMSDWERQIESSHADGALELSHQSFAGSFRRYRDELCYVAPLAQPVAEWAHEWRGESRLAWPHGTLEVTRHAPREPIDEHIDYSTEIDSSIGERAVFRLWRRHDVFAFSPNEKCTSLKNMFQQRAVPTWLRAAWPILEIDGEIAAVVGIGISAVFRMPPEAGTQRATQAAGEQLLWFRWRPAGAPPTVVFDCGPMRIASFKRAS